MKRLGIIPRSFRRRGTLFRKEDLFARNQLIPIEDHGPLDDIFQLPDIAGPGIIRQEGERFTADRRLCLFALLAEEIQKVVDQKEEIFGPFPERRDRQ